jgi:hypothetical protein
MLHPAEKRRLEGGDREKQDRVDRIVCLPKLRSPLVSAGLILQIGFGGSRDS